MDEPSDLTSPPGWYPDPVHRYEFRWFNGRGWTADVSVDGGRFIDSLDRSATAPMAAGSGPTPGGPSRTLAILAIIFGLSGLAIAWVPFLFVIGGLAAISAIVLGIVALHRASAGLAAGRRMAVTGIVAGIAALGLCVVGFVFTRAVVDELNDFTDPGPVHAVITRCTVDAAGLQIQGTISNNDDHTHDYVIVVAVRDRVGRRATSRVEVDDVAAGQQQVWSTIRVLEDLDAASVECEVRDVDGPYPFDLDDD